MGNIGTKSAFWNNIILKGKHLTVGLKTKQMNKEVE
jgi:hypothetical protein